jgi:anthranilate synthase component 1
VRPLPDLETFRTLCKPGRAVPVRVEVDADTETPVSAFLKLSQGKKQAFLLESVEGGERSARFSFLGAGPRKVLRWKLGDAGDPLARVRAALASHRAVRVPGCPPFAGGLVGHVAYDAVKLFEPHVPISKPDELGFPDVLLMDFDEVVAFDNLRHSLHVMCEVRCERGDDPDALYAGAVRRIRARLRDLARRGPPGWSPGSRRRTTSPPSSARRSTSGPATASRSCSRSASTPRSRCRPSRSTGRCAG